jgi:hypothetical protein
MVTGLAERAGISDFDAKDPAYTQVLDQFIATYSANELPDRVDRLLGSLAAGWKRSASAPLSKATASDHSSKAKPKPSPPPGGSGDGSESGAEDEETVLDDFLNNAADEIANAEVVTASNLGPIASAAAFSSAEGLELEKVWQAVMDDVTRPSHADADGQTQPLDAPFDVGDDQLLFPTDASLGAGAAEVRFCRCVMTFDVAGATKTAAHQWADTTARVINDHWEEAQANLAFKRTIAEWDRDLKEIDG